MLSTILISTLLTTTAGALPKDALDAYSSLLAKHVKDGQVDYKAIAKEPDLAKMVIALAKVEVPKERDARIALYIDAYNAFVIQSVIEQGRPRSVLDVKGFFNEKGHMFAGKKVTLDELEKKILNPDAKDPRTHMVLVCGAVGCPILESKPYSGGKLEPRLDAATRRYLASRHGAIIKPGEAQLSKIFDWYKADFGGDKGVLEFVKKHLSDANRAKLGAAPKVSYIDYNWTLNQK